MRSDAATGLDWMSVRAYDPTTGRFISRDPLGRAPLYFSDNPYVYAGNNPLSNVDPSGQFRAAGFGAAAQQTDPNTNQLMAHNARVQAVSGCDAACEAQQRQEWDRYHIGLAKGIAGSAEAFFDQAIELPGLFIPLAALIGSDVVAKALKWLDGWISFKFLEQLSPFTVIWSINVLAVATYDIVDVAAKQIFANQTTQSDAYWPNPNDLSITWGAFGLTVALLGTLFTGLSLALMALSPQFSPVWAALAIGFDVAVFRLLPHFKEYIDEEQQTLGYTQI